MTRSMVRGNVRRIWFALALSGALLAAMAGPPEASAAVVIGTTTRVSVATGGAQANGFSGSWSNTAISADGRYVAFDSGATNLVAGDTNGRVDVFVRDRFAGVTSRVSLSATGAQGIDGRYGSGVLGVCISADGRYVAFASDVSNLTPGDTDGDSDVFLRDRVAGTTTLVSAGSGGVEPNAWSGNPSISADGRYVAFDSDATNLVAGDTNGAGDVFVRDCVAGVTTRVSVLTGGGQLMGGFGQDASISADGRYVAFYSNSSSVVPDDSNGMADVFIHDRITRTTTRVNLSATGAQASGGDSGQPSVSGDGRYVVFSSFASNLVAGDTNGMCDVFVRDRVAATTVRVSVATNGAQASGGAVGSGSAKISADGRYVAFRSGATNLVPGDTNGTPDIFIRDLARGITSRVNVASGGAQVVGSSYGTSISADGGCVAFASDAVGLVPNDTNGLPDIFVRQMFATVENDAPGVTFGRFINGFSSAYSGGSYTYAYSKAPYTGSRLEARFKGNKVRWMGPKNPAYGTAKVYIDGVYKATVDCYGTATRKATLWESALLTEGLHTISIEMASGKNPASSGYVVVVDCFEVEGAAPSRVGARANESDGVLSGTWIKATGNPTYTSSSYAYSYWPPAKFRYTFTGTKCAWIGPKVYNYGKAAVYLDGIYRGTISQYAPATATSFRVRVWESPTLAKGTHTLEIRPLGAKVTAATGRNVVVDAVDYIQ